MEVYFYIIFVKKRLNYNIKKVFNIKKICNDLNKSETYVLFSLKLKVINAKFLAYFCV